MNVAAFGQMICVTSADPAARRAAADIEKGPIGRRGGQGTIGGTGLGSGAGFGLGFGFFSLA
ncbi:hypothetical protein [Micromonospora inyonensis]|uniref:Uncharacterized protein n=1 Tax=Micromonospora inyonensis TaxID=47866 RepID=A0A1C6RFZ8_9ACTN|nr:hypothetical protein [Micromonospora inyonensis]SCL16088.1 hypothetical protein GA0074694_1487 [Micromonospora inyonensis]